MSVSQLNNLLIGTYFQAREEGDKIILSIRGRKDVDVVLPYCPDDTMAVRDEYHRYDYSRAFMRELHNSGTLQTLDRPTFHKRLGDEIHHNFPIGMGGINHIKNFRLIPAEVSGNLPGTCLGDKINNIVHVQLHELVWVPLAQVLRLYECPKGKSIHITMPKTPRIIMRLAEFISDEYARRAIAAELACQKAAQKRRGEHVRKNAIKEHKRRHYQEEVACAGARTSITGGVGRVIKLDKFQGPQCVVSGARRPKVIQESFVGGKRVRG